MTAFSGFAQENIKLGQKRVAINGTVFNEIVYLNSMGQTKVSVYRFLDKANKTLVITEVESETEAGRSTPTKIEIYRCPLAKIDKQASYNIEMENDAVAGW